MVDLYYDRQLYLLIHIYIYIYIYICMYHGTCICVSTLQTVINCVEICKFGSSCLLEYDWLF